MPTTSRLTRGLSTRLLPWAIVNATGLSRLARLPVFGRRSILPRSSGWGILPQSSGWGILPQSYHWKPQSRSIGYVILAASLAQLSFAQEFSVATSVCIEEKVVARTTSIFFADVVYDFALAVEGDRAIGEEVMIVDLNKRTLTLLDRAAELHTATTFDVIENFSRVVAAQAQTERHRPLIRFAAAPQYDRSWDTASDKLKLNSDLVSYAAELTQPEHELAPLQYRLFADVAAHLQTMSPGIPAQARLQLNEEIAQLNRLPTEITKRVGGRSYTSKHTYNWKLNQEQHEILKQIKRSLERADWVEFAAYLQQRRP